MGLAQFVGLAQFIGLAQFVSLTEVFHIPGHLFLSGYECPYDLGRVDEPSQACQDPVDEVWRANLCGSGL